MDELLKMLKENALEKAENLAKMLDMPVDEVRAKIREYEETGVIRGYHAIVDEDKLDLDRVTAVIEVKVTPERDGGFDRIAKRISKFESVKDMYLMSGTYDLLLFVAGPNLKEVASFVSEKLATIEGVTSTSTHFMLKTYKHHGLLMEAQDEYERLKVTP
ncbi:MAG: Lrp/AsnC family transcriptional regulator [Verrucomicrobia bacterium]|nr:Lrp/AsnC family transcriptional regulator [Verrucomicrobiota bacterium]